MVCFVFTKSHESCGVADVRPPHNIGRTTGAIPNYNSVVKKTTNKHLL